MIIDIQQFIEGRRAIWTEFEERLEKLESRAAGRLSVREVMRLHYLYERVSADLAAMSTFAAERTTREYLEALVARAYGEIHETRDKTHRFAPLRWFLWTFPCTFRRQWRAFQLATLLTIVGAAFGGIALSVDPAAKSVILPFDHLLGDPSERVHQEEGATNDQMRGSKIQGAAWYWTHNTRVSLTTMALGFTWGIGTIILLFYNGVILGAVITDYLLAGEAPFLIGWLLPHGAVEIPAILVAGQAGLVLAGALIGWKTSRTLRERMRQISPDLVTLVFGVALMLFWAGIIESFMSQYHEPVLPYSFKIAFGTFELALLFVYLGICGRKADHRTPAGDAHDAAD
jgi:uncharacterized membrane protein SpoIIM required for sporulation